MRDVSSKIAIVTGAGKGIGATIARRFAAENAAGVALLDISLKNVDAVAAELDPTGTRVLPLACNIASAEECKVAVDAIMAKWGRIDILVNNAGITRDRMFHKMSHDEWHSVIDVNLNGMFNMCRNVIPIMREQMGGAIVNISSTSLMGNAGQANYAAAKAAMQGFTRTMAKEGGPKNIRVNCVAPGFIDTDMMRAIGEEKLANAIAKHPMRRMAQPDEIASIVEFLCTDDASWINGTTIFASGGATTG